MSTPPRLHRVLLVDDTRSIHEVFRQCLRQQDKDELAAEEEDLFNLPGHDAADWSEVEMEVDSAYTGEEALAKVEEAMREGKLYSLAFVDVRMPTGWDGIETIEHLWKVDPHLEVVVCTAFSDYSWQELVKRLRHSDRFLILKKPFAGIEIKQMALSLATKFEMRLERENQVRKLEAAVQTAVQASAAKSEFLANMSHEIRTPLNGVVGMLELLSDTPMEEEESRFVRGAQASVNCLLSLVNDILDFSKIEAGKVELDPTEFNLHQMVEDVAEILAHRAEQKGIEICCDLAADLPYLVVADADRIRQVLLNLAGNSVKFTENGHVVLRARPKKMELGKVLIEIEVEDTGIGIAGDQKERLFQVFTQGDSSTTRRYGGTGLGLALCKRLVELLGGEIGYDSTPGVGSTFRFTVAAGLGGGVSEVRSLPEAFEKLRVLVVDDNPINLEIVRSILARWGIGSGLSSYAPDALTELRSAHRAGQGYDLIITDMQMPDIDGLGFVRRVRSLPEFANIPVIMLSSMGQVVPRDQLSEIGLAACLGKPVRQSRLFEVIIGALSANPRERPDLSSALKAVGPVTSPPFQYRILVAEDNEMNQHVMRAYLKKMGMDCTIVASGVKAVEHARLRCYDLVLMDWQMPELNGLEAAREIRICEQFAGGLARDGGRLPVIAVTAHATLDDRDQCLEAGMDGYLIKPVNTRALAETLKEHLVAAPQVVAAVCS